MPLLSYRIHHEQTPVYRHLRVAAGRSLLTPIHIESSAPNTSWIARLPGVLELDRAVAFTVLAKGWWSRVVAALIVVDHFFSPAGQGCYYTCYSLVGLQPEHMQMERMA
jgi:hypothetical protein